MHLPPCNSIAVCPKCEAVEHLLTVQYHVRPVPTSQGAEPCTELAMITPGEELEGFGEHLCKCCSRCGFGWVEAVADDAPLYDEPSEEPETEGGDE